ncbi:S41 family peptidase [Flavobacteriaceae bacterium AH-315-B10]|nr:S41 family peptidase [Flavobacteriaceae bacterium AH-315-B10]
MKNYRSLKLIIITLLMFQTNEVLSQDIDTGLTSKQISVVIDSIGNKLKANYIFPDVADKMAEKIEEKEQKGLYKSIDDPREFANILTEDLQSVSKDKHIRVMYDPERIMEFNQRVTAEDSIKFLNNYVANLKKNNFGFKEVKILGGNIGYLDLRSFSDVEYAGETATAAMNFLSNTVAIIIDLRNNGGGSPAMIQLITSYLYNSEPVHLNNFYWRPTDRHTQTWTLPHVPGNRNPDAAVYILTSNRTFSAAEEFCYNLKNLKRATLIGETTGGGAHPGGSQIANERFMVWIPTGRAINPITNTNWEGTGVSPHIEVKADKALTIARIKALEDLIDNTDNEENTQFYNWSLGELKSISNPVILEDSVLKSFIGTYGPRVISFENGKLFYQRDSGTKYELVPLSHNEFRLIGLSYFRVKFLSENNKIVALKGLYEAGNTDKHLKNKE